MDKRRKLQMSFYRLYKYCRTENYRGWDNFDGLKSKVFNKTPFYQMGLCRLVWIQFFKRSPVNFRRLTFVPKDYNPKGLALFVSGLVLEGNYSEAKWLINLLKGMSCQGYDYFCWGYNFDWQSRNFLTPNGTPNTVCTVFVANALLDYYAKTGDQECLDMAISACRFFVDNLVLFEDENTLFFGYMPGSKTRVYNVNMLGAATLARVYAITGDKNFYDKSKKAMTYSVDALQRNFSWVYGEGKHQEFIDNFHTGFNLMSLYNWMKFTGQYLWEHELKRAYEYYLETFWLDNGCPKYYHNSLYPIDIHASAQGIVTCLSLAKYDKKNELFAGRIAEWAIDNMQDREGFFYYQKTKWYTNTIPYIRWSQAWMFYALSCLIHN